MSGGGAFDRAGALGLILALLALPALAKTERAYPSDPSSEASVQAWIDKTLDTKGWLIAAWSPHVLMFVAARDLDVSAYPKVMASVWTEVIDPQSAVQVGWRSALDQREIGCDTARYRSLSTLTFSRSERKGDGQAEAAAGDWLTPDPGATMDTVVRAVCFSAREIRLGRDPLPAAEAIAGVKPAPGATPPQGLLSRLRGAIGAK